MFSVSQNIQTGGQVHPIAHISNRRHNKSSGLLVVSKAEHSFSFPLNFAPFPYVEPVGESLHHPRLARRGFRRCAVCLGFPWVG